MDRPSAPARRLRPRILGPGGLAVVCAVVAAATPGTVSAATVAERDDAVRMTVRSGQILVIRLRENPSTGYAWRVVRRPRPAVLSYQSRRFVSSRCPAGTTGCPGHRLYRYEAEDTGLTSLTLRLYPPGRGTRPVQTFRLTVRVR